MLKPLLIAMICVPAIVEAQTTVVNPNFDPAALKCIDTMRDAFAKVKKVSIVTSYSGKDAADLSITSAKISVERPNHVLIEITRVTRDRPIPTLTRVVCDGKFLYTYRQERSQFTRDVAPKDFREMQNLASGLELAAITGLDPFRDLLHSSRAISLIGTAPVDGVTTEVVQFDGGDEKRTTIMRFFIGQSDHLLRRMEYSATANLTFKPTYDPTNPNDLPPLDPPKPIQFAYENHIIVDGKFDKGTFEWVAPSGALLLQESADSANIDSKTGKVDKKKKHNPIGVPDNVKIYTLEEMIKRSKKHKP